MNSFPISDKDLLNIQKPAQYMGGEKNAVLKNWDEIEAKILLSFPDVYEVGMSHVGIQILYDLINSNPKALAERAYMPFPDMEKVLKDNKQSLYALESKRPLIDFDVIGFSLQYELCGTNILAMLELSNIPIYASDRTEEHPLIIGGGPYSYHPEPLAPFFDLFFLGDAEEFIPELIEAKVGVDMEVRLPLSTFLSNFDLYENRIDFSILTGVGLISPSSIEIVKQLTELQLGDFILVKSEALFANNNHPNMRITVNKNKIINSPQFENHAV